MSQSKHIPRFITALLIGVFIGAPLWAQPNPNAPETRAVQEPNQPNKQLAPQPKNNRSSDLDGTAELPTGRTQFGQSIRQEPEPTLVTHTPEAKRLLEQLRVQESAATAEAEVIRQLQANGQAEQNKLPIDEHDRKLAKLLGAAFDLKLQLEGLQVKELQSRLSRLEGQIGKRKELRDRIIARRASELIGDDTLQWWTPKVQPTRQTYGIETRVEAETHPARNKATPTVPDGMTQIRFTGPHGMKILMDTPTHNVVIAQGRHNFPRDQQQPREYAITVQWTDEVKYAATLVVYPATRSTEEYLQQHSIPLTVTGEDVNQVAMRNGVTKVVYLPDLAHQDLAKLSSETLVSTRLDPGTDPILEANRRGTILAVLRFDKQGISGNASTSKTESPPPQAERVVVDLYGGSKVLAQLSIHPSYSKLIQSLNALPGVVTNFREAGAGADISLAIVRDPTQRFRRETQQTQKESVLRVAINTALTDAGILNPRWEEGVDEAEAHMLLGIPGFTGGLDSAAAAALVWEHLGLKLGAPVDSKDIQHRYRGGLRIVDVDPQRSASKSGIRKGDTLVGLGVWETRSLDDILFVLRDPTTQPKAGMTVSHLKAFLVRDGEMLFTEFEFGGITAIKP